MQLMPRTAPGRRAVAMLVPVLTYPLWWSVLLVLPRRWGLVAVLTGVAVMGLAVAGLGTAAVALAREHDRSPVLVACTGLVGVLVLFFVLGEAFGPG